MTAQTVADHLLGHLREWGVDTVFGYPGNGINGLMAAWGRADNHPRFVQARHEEMAAFEAVGYAKFTGRMGVCVATSGPGAIHLLNGLYDAKLDHVPVLAIIGQTNRSPRGGSYQQEVDPLSLFKDVASDYVQMLTVAEQLPNVADRAIRTALGRRAPTAIVLPADVQELPYSAGPGVPYGIGAKFGCPHRPVIVFAGDGAMQMNGLAELITVKRYREQWRDPRLIIAVLHNDDLNQVTWEMRAMSGAPKFVESQRLPDVDYAGFAASLGLRAIAVDKPGDIAPAWERALSAEKPTLLDVRCDPNVPPIPPHANGGYQRKQAIRVIRAAAESDIRWFEEPVSSDDLAGLREVRDAVLPDVAVGEYGSDLAYFPRMCAAGAVDCVQADASRCGGITEWLPVAAVAAAHNLEISGHCAPNLHAHVAMATPNLRHLEWFHDHVRIEQSFLKWCTTNGTRGESEDAR